MRIVNNCGNENFSNARIKLDCIAAALILSFEKSSQRRKVKLEEKEKERQKLRILHKQIANNC